MEQEKADGSSKRRQTDDIDDTKVANTKALHYTVHYTTIPTLHGIGRGTETIGDHVMCRTSDTDSVMIGQGRCWRSGLAIWGQANGGHHDSAAAERRRGRPTE